MCAHAYVPFPDTARESEGERERARERTRERVNEIEEERESKAKHLFDLGDYRRQRHDTSFQTQYKAIITHSISSSGGDK
jgi:hypothetical protein